MSRITYIEAPCKSVLNRVEGMPFKWSINPYTGCAHACRYCYARAFYTKADKGTSAQFDQLVYVKSNAPEVLRGELRKRSWKREMVVVGAATDPYQPGEARYKITRGILSAMLEARSPVSIITKGPLVLRDLDLLRQIAEVAGAEVNLTIPSLDEKAWRTFEPGAPPPRARLEAVRRLNAAGVRAGVFIAPMLPGITESEGALRELIGAARDAGATHVLPITLRLAPGVREWFLPFLSREYPELTLQYCRLYQKTEARPDYKHRVTGLARAILQEFGLEAGPGKMERSPAEMETVQQLRLSI